MPRKKKAAFDNARVTELTIQFTRSKKNLKECICGRKEACSLCGRDKILERVLPLVNAALVKRRVPIENYDDVRQECILKLLKNISKFDPSRGKAFAFFWTIICNTINTQNQRWTSTSVSLTATESASSDTEITGAEVFQTPENQYILNRITASVDRAFNQNGFRIPDGKKHKKAFILISKAIQTGEFFFNRSEVMKKLRHLGLQQSEIQHYVSYTLIKVRQNLLDSKKELTGFVYGGEERRLKPRP